MSLNCVSVCLFVLPLISSRISLFSALRLLVSLCLCLTLLSSLCVSLSQHHVCVCFTSTTARRYEEVNLADDPAHADVVAQHQAIIRGGWVAQRPKLQ
jgi:hypothetical protein